VNVTLVRTHYLPNNIGLFRKRALYKRHYSAKETYVFEEPTHYVIYTTYITMGMLRLVGSLTTQVSFVKEPYIRDIILQKRPILLKEPTHYVM